MVMQHEHVKCYMLYIKAQCSLFPLFFIHAGSTAVHSVSWADSDAQQLLELIFMAHIHVSPFILMIFLLWRNLFKEDAANLFFLSIN